MEAMVIYNDTVNVIKVSDVEGVIQGEVTERLQLWGKAVSGLAVFY